MAYKYYFIRSKSSGHVLDVAGGSARPGVQVIVWNQDKDKYNQQWRFDDETKTVRSKLSDSFVLDISGATLIVNEFEAGKASQRWQRVDGEKLLNVNDPAYCIDLCASDPAPGATVIKYPFFGTRNQLWEFEAVYVPRQEFYIVSQLHGKVVGIRPGTSLLEIQPKAHPQQKTQLFYEGDDGYLRSAANDLSLSAKKGSQLSLTQDNTNAWDQWKFDETGVKVLDGNNVALDIKGGFENDGQDVVSWDWHDSTNQKWGKELVPLPVQIQPRLENFVVPTSSASYPPHPFVELRPGQWGFQFPLPSVDVSLPSVDIKPPSVDVSPPSVDVSLPSVDASLPSVDVSLPSVDVSLPSVSVGLPSVDVSLPSVDIKPPSVDVSLPSVDVSLPSVDVSHPSVDVSHPSVDVSLPSVDVSLPSVDVSLPSVSVGLPSLGLGHGSVGVGLPPVDIKPPPVNVTLPPLGSGGSPRQEFYIESQLHGKVATVNSSGKLEIQPKAATVEKNQLFFADSDGYLHSAANDLALTAKKGDQFSLSPDSADPSTQWQFDDSGARVVDAAGNVLDIQGGFLTDGLALVSWEDKKQNNQRWRKVVV